MLLTPQGRAELERLRAVRPELVARIAAVSAELVDLAPGPVIPDRFYGSWEFRSTPSSHNSIAPRRFAE